ncbi:hypothetical protein [Actinomadura fibrosa]|uniref:Uncharacterized protein n=1 Tax=Actinomadura fibrosa TaxID=111802 RepID=A0ABW2XLB4_9ACTN|nr:hypothetical protein [Actinomadura fibrosa]
MQSVEAERKRLGDLEQWAHSALEDRHKVLWAERKALYSRLIGLTEKWIRCNIDLIGIELPDGVMVQSHEDAANASPIVARYFEAAHNFGECFYEIEILGHAEVIAKANALHLSLIQGTKAALEGENNRERSEAAKRDLLRAMRRGLTEM